MKCTMAADSHVSGCQIIAEDPQGYDFGVAALRSARLFRIAPQTGDGTPTAGASVVFRIFFEALCDHEGAPASTDVVVRPDVRDGDCH